MIYLDAAATTLQKPPEVADAVGKAISTMSTPGRGGYAEAMIASRAVYQTRELIAKLFHLRDPSRVLFTKNATESLNIAIKGLTLPGDEVVISCLEHNAVMRPLWCGGRRIRVAGFPASHPEAATAAFAKTITGRTKCVVCTCASNVFGSILPIDSIDGLCYSRGIPLVLDASQSAGTVPMDVSRLHAEAVCMPGHKGLYGPQGTGVLLLLGDRKLRVLLEGGTGSRSASYDMPEDTPDRFEAGTVNVPGICGLYEGVRFVMRMGENTVLRHERDIAELVREELRSVAEFPGRGDPAGHTGVIAFRVPGMDCELLAERLGEEGISVRAGLCCAPLAHRSQGTFKTGLVRVSPSAFSTFEDGNAL